MEVMVWDYICCSILEFARKEGDIHEFLKDYRGQLETEIKNMICKKEKTKNEKERIITMFQKGYIDEKELQVRLISYEKEVAKLDAEAAGKRKELKTIIKSIEEDWEGGNAFYIIEEILKSLNNEDKKYITRVLLSEVCVSENTIVIKGCL